jgi:hypothetical protein
MLPRLILLLLLIPSSAAAEDIYVVNGAVRGFFCRFFGMVCAFKKVDGLAVGKEDPRPLPPAFAQVSEHKSDRDGQRCWITTKADASRLGWWATLLDWWNEAPTFYAVREDGTYDELGSPEFIVFSCAKLPAPSR